MSNITDSIEIAPGIIYSEFGGPNQRQKCVGASVCVDASGLNRTAAHCALSEKYAAYCCQLCNKWTHKHPHTDVCMANHIWFKTGNAYEEDHKDGPEENARREWAQGILTQKASILGKKTK